MLAKVHTWRAGTGWVVAGTRGRSRFGGLAAGHILAFVLWQMLASASAQPLTVEDFNLIDEGFRVFNEETFDGNGRTCGTCHIPAVNYNIFPSTIKNMNKKDQALVFATNVPGLENINLVKAHALFNISGNASTHGADEPDQFGTAGHEGPVFRGSMGLQAFLLTSTNTSANFPGTPLLPAKCSAGFEGQLRQLGWSGDAPPGTPHGDADCHIHHGNFDPKADGSTRAFANGAIAQHNTKSLNRVEGTDFRFATDDEADALEAFQNWLGRRALTTAENNQQGTTAATEFDISRLDFTDDRIDLGRDHFAGPAEFTVAGGVISSPNPGAGAGCNGCHTNAGANTGVVGGGPAVGGPNNRGQNININTDAELGSDDIGLRVVGFALPHDEGASNSFGPRPAAGPDFEESFNIQSIIEAARKEAWFHNHRVVGDFEQAIAFYISPDFRREGDPAGPPPAFTSEQVMRFGNSSGSISFPNGNGVEHVGAFLRTLSAYYSLRDCERLVQETIDRINVGASPDLAVMHCQFNLEDVRKVLKGAKLSPRPYFDSVGQKIPGMKVQLKEAMRLTNKDKQLQRLQEFLGSLQTLRNSIAIIPELS